jgi:hypothetical protein
MAAAPLRTGPARIFTEMSGANICLFNEAPKAVREAGFRFISYLLQPWPHVHAAMLVHLLAAVRVEETVDEARAAAAAGHAHGRPASGPPASSSPV